VRSQVFRPRRTSAQTHAVLLSGGFITIEQFEAHGFIEALHARHPDCGLSIAEVRMAYFADASIGERVHAVVDAARREGARRVWLAGISLGGLAALSHAARDADIAGVALFSPYPGTRPMLQAIEAAGGLAAWAAAASATDVEQEAWLWLARRAPRTPPMHAWYGSSDRFVAGQRLLARALAGDNVHEIAGGHDWPDWREMWIRFLETDSLR
jgi:pimeloyl-ACP methyl ester carboxylesterase